MPFRQARGRAPGVRVPNHDETSRASGYFALIASLPTEEGNDQAEQQHSEQVFRELDGAKVWPCRPRRKRNNYVVHDEEDDGAKSETASDPPAAQDVEQAGRERVDRGD